LLPPTSLGSKSSTVDVPFSSVTPPKCKPNSPLFKISSKAINVDSPDFAEAFYPKACVVTEPSENPYIITGPPELLTTKELQSWAKDTLPDVVKQPLFDINCKKTKSMRHTNISFTSEYRFRHIIPFLYLDDFLDAESQKNLEQVSFLAKQFSELKTEYGLVDMNPIRGFENCKNFQDETELNKNQIHLHSAALLQYGCDVEKLVYYIRGPHVGANCNVPKILKDLWKEVQPTDLAEIKDVFEHGSPRKINATNTEKNLKDYYYGNHESVTITRRK
jgi:hypothetical protein